MRIEKIEENCCQSSEVSKFYEGKSVFITGAGGFLGKVLLEILLRCCPGILRIYILLRPKKGLEAEDRKKEIFKREIFHNLKEKNPDALNKVFVVAGDISQDNLGMYKNDLNRIIQEVSVVFHCAASISFFKPISFVMSQNVISTDNVISFCKKMNKLEALVYTSTIFSNSNRKRDIDEIVYELPFKAEEAVRLARIGDEDALNILFSKCNPKFPNYYTFSKCVSENLLVEKASDLPVSIVRPSLIIACMEGSLPGYVEEGSALVNLTIGVGKGLLHVMKMDGEKKLEFIPADIAANTHVVAAFFQSYQRFTSPRVYNCTSGNMAEHSWSEFIQTTLEVGKKYPLPNSFIIPSLTLHSSPFAYKFYAFIYHTLPAIIIDALFWIAGGKFRLFKLYNFQEKMMKIAEPFLENQWNFSCDNFVSLSEKLNETDAEIFNVDVRKFRLKEYALSLYTGSPFYRLNNKIYKDTFSACFLRYFVTYSIKFLVFGSIATLFYIVI